LHLSAQQTITGKVTDVESNLPMPYVNVFVKGSLNGTQTNIDGYYTLSIETPADSIRASFIGYKTLSKKINRKNANNIIDFSLKPDVTNLHEIVIKAKENPALAIIRKSIANKDSFNRNKLNNYAYFSYNKQQVFVDNIGPRFRKLRIFKPLIKYYQQLDSLKGKKSKATVPVYFSENATDIYVLSSETKTAQNIHGIRLNFVGKKESFLANQLSGSDLHDYNFYNNNIQFFDKNFLSPIADGAIIFYNYRLVDTALVDTDSCFQISVAPKNKQDLAFTGTIWICKNNFALKKLELEITKDVNINLIENVIIHQKLNQLPSKEYVIDEMFLKVDGANLTKNFMSFIFQSEIKDNRYRSLTKQDSIEPGKKNLDEEVLQRKPEYWNENRPFQLTNEDVKNFEIIDTISNIPFVKRGTELAYFLGTGYKTIGKIDLGSLQTIYAKNKVEGDRIKLNLRTNMYFSKSYTLRGYLAYGMKDQVLKYNAQIEKILSRYPWIKLGIQHRNDYDQLGVNYSYSRTTSLDNGGSLYTIGANLFNLGKMVHNIEYRSWLDFDFPFGVSNRLSIQHINSNALFNLTGNKDYLYNKNTISSEIKFDTRISLKEYYLQNGNDRVSLGNRTSPVITFSYAHGFNNVLGSNFGYDKAQISFKNTYKFGIWGRSNVFLNAGMIFTQAPFLYLETHRGNETSFYSASVFNTMGFFEFVSDRYVSLQLQHHFYGLLLNRIPVIKKFKWREFITGNVLFGKLTNNNKAFNVNNDFSVLNNKPFIESGFGFENIFKIIRVDFVYRLTYRDLAYQNLYNSKHDFPIQKFALKFSIGFGL
jgi:hypothetical protein